ncbi:MAG: hypothetical protein MJ092_06525 [Lachnospiraceae bacterium]|nr:hypothetical protein [Lachnospiraceae bacterium]
MEFDNKIFKKHYGKIYLDIIWTDALLCTALILVYLAMYFIKNVDESIMIRMMFAIVIIVSISIIFILPFLVFSYLSALNKSKRQQQYYSRGHLIVELPSKNGFSLGLSGSGMNHYEVRQITDVSFTRRYVIIEGTIQATSFDRAKNDKGVTLNELKIPISFTDYDKITP